MATILDIVGFSADIQFAYTLEMLLEEPDSFSAHSLKTKGGFFIEMKRCLTKLGNKIFDRKCHWEDSDECSLVCDLLQNIEDFLTIRDFV